MLLIRFYIDEINDAKQELRATKEFLEESEEKSGTLEGEIQKYATVCCIRIIILINDITINIIRIICHDFLF